MKHPIEQSFDKQMRENPHHSTFVNFNRAIRGRGLSSGLVFKYFMKLVDKDDWEGNPWAEISKILVEEARKPLFRATPILPVRGLVMKMEGDDRVAVLRVF